ncbi:cysteine hydrolase family protein [Marispirochaeta sp.]|uniref:cysteine hydrolase family protein n=1 Tax=Marispirochaeta sp. TaxID=2038653 RepID=UPI003748A0A3
MDKYRWSAFYQTSLELFLQSTGAKNIIIGGLVTDGCLMTSVMGMRITGIIRLSCQGYVRNDL